MSKANKGFNIVLNEIFECNDLDFVDVSILIFLKKHMFNNKNTCWVSIKTIAKHAKLSYVTILHRLHSLAERGYIAIKSGAKAGTTNVYEMLVDFFSTLSSAKKGNKKENEVTSQNGKQYNNTKEKAYQAMYAGNSTTRNYDIDMLEQQLLKASFKQR
ncbi:helix-turn-helix domain-containing protein [Thermoanaerobacterium thermosulfurigenes]|uniref:helix-turn-helix domain-containing protein n=1 Tax=Thermoanaerobacterium thermosulfurigenes TaxID=33950 RepID=UPI003EF45810